MEMLSIDSPLDATTVTKFSPFPRVVVKLWLTFKLSTAVIVAVPPEVPMVPPMCILKIASVNVPVANAKRMSLSATWRASMNATPVVRHGYRLGVPGAGFYREIINTDAETYGGSNVGNMGGFEAEDFAWQGRMHSLMISLPPLATVAFKREEKL